MASIADHDCERLESVCKPDRIEIEKWGLPRVNLRLGLDHDQGAREHISAAGMETAARIIFFSKREGRWVPVTVQQLNEMMQQELAVFRKVNDERRQREAQQTSYRNDIGRYWMMCLLTLGLAALVLKKPQWPEDNKGTLKKIPRTGIYFGSISFIRDVGIPALVRAGLLHEETEGRIPIWYLPTEGLLRMIIKEQEQITVTPQSLKTAAPNGERK